MTQYYSVMSYRKRLVLPRLYKYIIGQTRARKIQTVAVRVYEQMRRQLKLCRVITQPKSIPTKYL